MDERPFEEIINTTVMRNEFKEQVEDVLLRIDVDEHFQYKSYKSSASYTIYDSYILIMKNKRKEKDVEYKINSKKFEELCGEYGDIAPDEEENEYNDTQEKENTEEEDDVNVEDVIVGQKDFVANQKNKKKTSTKEEDKEKAALQLRIQKLKSTMANTQQKLIDLQKEITSLDEGIALYEYYQEIDRKYQRYMKKLVEKYEKDKDRNFLVKGIYNSLQYYTMIREHFTYKA